MMRPLISARSSVEKTARRRPTATISSEMDAGFARDVGIFSSRRLPKSPGLICFHIQRPPQPTPARTASEMSTRKDSLNQRDGGEEADMSRVRRLKEN